jgi:Raf kinase inhibitor-like YbhB/YbcL family protein
MPIETGHFAVTSPAFEAGRSIPTDHVTRAAGGRDASIPLEWTDPPVGTQSFAIEVVDWHPIARRWVHWLAVDLPADTRAVASGASGTAMPAGTRELTNTAGARGWHGPQPPPGSGPHDYHITVLALDTDRLGVEDGVSLDEFRRLAAPHVLTSASIVGTFER